MINLKILWKIIGLFVGTFILCSASASDFYFKNYKVEDGLSQNSVFCIHQDNAGFMWFGTNDGLNRFDGYNFRIYRKSKERHSIGNSKITCMVENGEQNLYVGTALGIYIYDPKTEMFSLFDKKTKSGTGISSRINSLLIDKQNKLWIATNEQGFFIYDIPKDILTHVKHDSKAENGLPSDQVDRIFVDSKMNVWVSCEGLYRYQPASGLFKRLNAEKDGSGNIRVSKFYEDNNGDIWIGTEDSGVQKFNREQETFTVYFNRSSSLFIPHIHDLIELSPGILAIGSNSGLVQFNTVTGNYRSEQSSSEKGTLSDNSIYCFYKDKEGSFWVGTFFGGVNYMHSGTGKIELYTHNETKNSIGGTAISRFEEDRSGNIWIATEDAGINYFDIEKKYFTQYLPEYNIQSILIEDNRLWLGAYGQGIILMDQKTKSYKKIPVNDVENTSGLLIKSIYKDSSGTIWVGSSVGLYIYDPETNAFLLIKGTEKVFVWDIIEDKNKDIWFVSSGNGAFKYNLRTKKMKNYLANAKKPNFLSDNFILTVCMDNNRQLWFGTEESGFCKYNYETDDFTCFNNLPKFDNRLIYAIVADNFNNIWFSTSNGLYRYTPETGSIRVFTSDEGLQSNQFNFNSGFKASNGKLYFGGVNGFNSFFPEDLKENSFIPPIRLTNFQILNKDVIIGAKDSPLKQALSYTNKIVLNHKQNVFNFEFVALSYVHPQKNQYAYKMEGFDKEWNNTDEHKVTYTSLPPGKYTFRVKGANNDGVWNEEGVSVELEIKPPFWKSSIAFVIYLLLLVGFIYQLNRSYVNRERKKQKEALEKAKTDKELELYNSKMNFFTNIAHEIKTPLSLIKAPLEKIINTEQTPEDQKSDLKLIERNTEQLQELITQLLDFRKMESGTMKTRFVSTDISELVENVYLNFKSTAKQRAINIILRNTSKAFYADVDRDALNKILSNILSNALKFTKDSIEINLFDHSDTGENRFCIEIKDNGIGIPDKEKENIFLPFRQIYKKEDKNGTGGIGIGLSYSRSLAELHSGSLSVKDNPSGGTVFILCLPKEQSDKLSEGREESGIQEISITGQEIPDGKDKKKHSLLIVEDNDDMREFLSRSFKNEYIVFTAINGKNALEILESNTPDMIITDLMMPVMDGIEFSKIVKNDINKSHIPLIMLTAKTTVESKIEGYAIGADAYVDKPFSIDLLKTRVLNLFENRDKIRANYLRSPYTQSITIANNKMDEDFISRMKNIIVENIQNESFSVDELARCLYMSRSGLFAKIKGISGMSPLDYIRIERLKKAAELLTEGKYSMAEIALMVGYSTPSYFSKAFQKQFGVLPKDFKKV